MPNAVAKQSMSQIISVIKIVNRVSEILFGDFIGNRNGTFRLYSL